MKRRPWVKIRWRDYDRTLRCLYDMFANAIHELNHLIIAVLVGAKIKQVDFAHLEVRRLSEKKCNKCAAHCVTTVSESLVLGFVHVEATKTQQFTCSGIDRNERHTRLTKKYKSLLKKGSVNLLGVRSRC